MQVLSNDDPDASIHIAYMKLAIEQAEKSIPVPSGYCVGAVLVQKTRPKRGRKLSAGHGEVQEGRDQGHRQRPSLCSPLLSTSCSESPSCRYSVVAVGFSRELPGNTHAEECCLIKLAQIQEQQQQQQQRQKQQQYAPQYQPRQYSHEQTSQHTTTVTQKGKADNVAAPSQQIERGEGVVNGSEEEEEEEESELIMYSTMEPCSHRLSGNRPCSDRLIASSVRTVYVGVREPDHFVKKVVGVEDMVQHGLTVVHIPGLERECLFPNRHVLGPIAATEATGTTISSDSNP